MQQISHLLRSFDPQKPFFPPTEIYNEGWLLRIILNWFSRNRASDGFGLSFSNKAGWFSEALLPTPFRARYQGDPLAEARTHADGVVGHFVIGQKGKTDLTLAPDATQLVVLEAKISSSLSSGIKNAPYYDQAARNVACIAEVLRQANRPPESMTRLGFHLLAPEAKIRSGAFDKNMDRQSIKEKVKRRVSEYDGNRDEWHSAWFVPTIDRVDIGVLSWEEVLARIGEEDGNASNSIAEFYEMCLKFN